MVLAVGNKQLSLRMRNKILITLTSKRLFFIVSPARCFFAFKEEFKCCSVLLALSFNDSRIESSGSGLDDPTNRAHISALDH